VQLDLGGALHGQRPRALADLQYGVGFLGAAADNAARPPVLETAADHVDTVGQQRRGQRVAVEALQWVAVVAKVERPIAVDAAAAGQTIPRHASVSGACSPMR